MKLEILDNPEGQCCQFTFEPGNDIVIGRAPGCQVRLRDDRCSRSHARIVCRNGAMVIQDAGSRNGTFVNGQLITELPLVENDAIAVGDTHLRVTDLPPQRHHADGQVTFSGGRQSVVMSMNYREADVLQEEGAPLSAPEALHENRLLRQISQISQLFVATPDTQATLEAVLTAVQNAVDADTACVLVQNDAGELTMRAATGRFADKGTLNVSRTIVQETLDKGVAVLTANPLLDARFDMSQSVVSQGISSAVCSPLKIGTTFDGVLFVDRRRREDAFEPIDLRLIATVGNVLGVFLQKARYEAEAQTKARLAIIGEVIAGLAHYIKNVSGGFDLAVSNLELAVEKDRRDWIDKCVATIKSMQRRITELMLNMLTYAKEREPERGEIQVATLIDDLVGPYARQLEAEGIALEIGCDEDAEVVAGDEREIFRALLNLFLNAQDAVREKPEGQRLIRLSVVTADQGSQVEFRLRDSGKGIPSGRLDSIFAPFFSTKGSRGTGLGLAVVKKIVDEHEGTISVDSEEDEWTEFRLRLPASESTRTQ